jgi:hypothetical protein
MDLDTRSPLPRSVPVVGDAMHCVWISERYER